MKCYKCDKEIEGNGFVMDNIEIRAIICRDCKGEESK